MVIETYKGVDIYQVEKNGRLMYSSYLGTSLSISKCRYIIDKELFRRHGVIIKNVVDNSSGYKYGYNIDYYSKYNLPIHKDKVLRYPVSSLVTTRYADEEVVFVQEDIGMGQALFLQVI